ncbi:ATP-binding Cassette (ABC) Superfamily, partial [Achlya hypogyna]
MPPVVTSFTELSSDASSLKPLPSIQRRLLQIVDTRGWHYTIMALLVVDFVANCLGVAATTTETYADISSYLRGASAGCLGCELLDMALRMLGMRSMLVKSPTNLGDMIVYILLLVTLACRFVFADDLSSAKILEDGFSDKWELYRKYKLDQVESYIAVGYCMLVTLRILLKPPARTYSKTLHRAPKPDRILIQSLRAAIRQLPHITAVAVEKMETDLQVLSGADDGWMLPELFMTFVERAYAHRPAGMTTAAFLTHFQQVQLAPVTTYGMREVMASTFRHWANERWLLVGTLFVVGVAAAIVPLLSYFLKILTDEAFPTYVNKRSTPVWDYVLGVPTGKDTLVITRAFHNDTADSNNERKILPFTAENQLYVGIIGVLGICVP